MPAARSRATQRQGVKFERTQLSTIVATEYPELLWLVEGYLPEGLSVLAGRQKLGKTWLALDFAVAVGAGELALGRIDCQKRDVLYLDLENGHRRLKRRIETMFPDARPDLGRISIVTDAPLLDEGLIPALECWRTSVAAPGLVVIDVLQRVKPTGSKARNAYENDYAIYQELQSWATVHGIAVLGLHHTRKGGADDPLEALSGSNGLSACADTTLVLDRDGDGTTLYVRGRDVEELETAISFNNGRWTILGDAVDVRKTDERAKILDYLLETGKPCSPSKISTDLGLKRNNVDQILHKMVKGDEVTRVGRGLYLHPKHSCR